MYFLYRLKTPHIVHTSHNASVFAIQICGRKVEILADCTSRSCSWGCCRATKSSCLVCICLDFLGLGERPKTTHTQTSMWRISRPQKETHLNQPQRFRCELLTQAGKWYPCHNVYLSFLYQYQHLQQFISTSEKFGLNGGHDLTSTRKYVGS